MKRRGPCVCVAAGGILADAVSPRGEPMPGERTFVSPCACFLISTLYSGLSHFTGDDNPEC